ncbi:hypothetical protein HPT29_020470 [Microvirga terrae]|uniref:Uncharacterized protein n=1 Tax=Microvirga terrae TaxID=2740529 RepID=A0ABY5RNL1_9HYPH|nr:hypothetical protein [Microvirga terrae]UVF18830.1 hypothetical protein HPT29_020470 [Microvirga terrae]
MRNGFTLLASVLFYIAAWSWADAECLPHKTAPGSFLNEPRTWGRTDTGPILNGFLKLKNGNGFHDIQHGVDLSHHNDRVDYAELKRCGASFAIVKMDGAFDLHRRALAAQGITILPYHYLSAADGRQDFKKLPGRFTSNAIGSAERPGAMVGLGHSLGTIKAQSFLNAYERALDGSEQRASLAGLQGQLIVLDVEEHFTVRSTQSQRTNFGRFYAAMLSAWVSKVQERYPDAKVIFYTFPDIFTSYLQFAFPRDYAVIHGMPVWLARTRGDASDFDLTLNKNLQRICLSSSGGNKCILHQYSHRAVFGVKSRRGANPPIHIDVNRLFHVREVRDDTGIQHVRRD